MAESCGRIDETLLSGYLDEMLTQADAQRVRLHLDTCAACRDEVDQMTRYRDATRTAQFVVPADDQWSEAPRTTASGVSRRAGWLLVVVWLVASLGYGGWELATSDEPLVAKLLIFGVWSGVGVLFLGVLLDRLAVMKTDRYREVQR